MKRYEGETKVSRKSLTRIKQLHAPGLFLYPLKTSENQGL